MDDPNNLGVKQGDPTPADDPAAKKDPVGSEPVKTPGEPSKTADELLSGSKRILVDKERFDDRNDKAKLYEAFAPIIDKVKDNPELVSKLLETDKKGSLEDRVAQMEEERRTTKRRELKNAVENALSKWKQFSDDWSEISDQVDLLMRRGVGAEDAIRRSYLALHPEEAQAEAERVAHDNANLVGQFSFGGARSPNIIQNKKVDVGLNEREKIVAQDLMGKDYGGGFVPIKSEEDYARLLAKHKDHLRARGFYDLP